MTKNGNIKGVGVQRPMGIDKKAGVVAPTNARPAPPPKQNNQPKK